MNWMTQEVLFGHMPIYIFQLKIVLLCKGGFINNYIFNVKRVFSTKKSHFLWNIIIWLNVSNFHGKFWNKAAKLHSI